MEYWRSHILLQDRLGHPDLVSPVWPGFSALSPHATPGQNHSLFSEAYFVFGGVDTGISWCPRLCWWPPIDTLSSPRVQIAANLLGELEFRSREGPFLVSHHLVLCFLLW